MPEADRRSEPVLLPAKTQENDSAVGISRNWNISRGAFALSTTSRIGKEGLWPARARAPWNTRKPWHEWLSVRNRRESTHELWSAVCKARSAAAERSNTTLLDSGPACRVRLLDLTLPIRFPPSKIVSLDKGA